jgi:GrpB-like predicted nucleotidyltransferase (UPF0157 family)
MTSDEAPVHIVPYDAVWPRRFEEERTLLLDAIGPWLAGPIEHIGSTAIPGLAAKPVVDMMAGVESLDGSFPAVAILESHAYCYYPYRPDVMHWFCKPSPAFRTHHLHLVPFKPALDRRLAFATTCARTLTLRGEYADLKYRLAEQHRFDREAYTDAKGPFVERILHEALGPAEPCDINGG